MDEERRLPSWLLPGLGVLVVVALVAAGLLKGTTQLDPSTPEGTVQSYLNAVFAGDPDAASQYTDGECDPNLGGAVDTEGMSATLVSVEGDDMSSTVVVRLSQTSDNPEPLGGMSEWQEWFNLINENGTWVIQQPVWPYYTDC